MVNTYIALFRGINVGGNNILPMKDLVKILEDLGFEKITTYIQSGNVVFNSGKKPIGKTVKAIRSAIKADFGFEPHVILLTSAELQDAIESNPFETTAGKALHVFFLDSRPARPDMQRLASLKSESEQFKLHKNLFYLYAPDGIGRSKLAANVEKTLGVPVTARNWNTVSKLYEMATQTQA